MTLTQYYELRVREMGFKCWNTFCAQATPEYRQHLKKQLKKEFKNDATR